MHIEDLNDYKLIGLRLIRLRIKLKFFALYRDIVGFSETHKELKYGSNIGDLLQKLFEEFPKLKKYRDEMNVSVNKNYSSENVRLSEGDEVAIFPPISGG